MRLLRKEWVWIGAAGLLAAGGCRVAPAPSGGASPAGASPAAASSAGVSSRPGPAKPSKEPSFRGRPLSEWVKQFQESEDYGARVQASEALTAIGGPAVPALDESLEDPELRFLASVALRKIGSPAVPEVVKTLDDPDEEIRIAAIGVLGGIGPQAQKAVPALMEVVKKGEPMERWAALEALGNIGPAARAAVPLVLDILEQKSGPKLSTSEKIRALRVLEGLLRDENELVRRTAASVLKKIR